MLYGVAENTKKKWFSWQRPVSLQTYALKKKNKKKMVSLFLHLCLVFFNDFDVDAKQSQPGERWGAGINWEFGLDIHLYLVIQLCPTL